MPLYEYRKNATNYVPSSEKVGESLTKGTDAVLSRLIDQAVAIAPQGQSAIIAIDGWYGVDFEHLRGKLESASAERNLSIEVGHIYDSYRSTDEIEEYQQAFETDDPSFGWVNREGVLEDLVDPDKLATVTARLQEIKAAGNLSLYVLLGPGAALGELADTFDLIAYADFTMQPMLWQMWDQELKPFARKEPKPDYYWKKYYYCDFYLLYRQKKSVFNRMDFYIDAVQKDDLKMLPADEYNTLIDDLVQQPIKQVKILQPGPWGAYRYRDLWDVEGLECNAWNELAGIELSILVNVGENAEINMPAQNIMQRPVQMVGEYVHREFPDLMPLQVWLDDGYFPEPVSWERSSMPIHNHPDTGYVRRNFNEPLGRYETYYIVESYKGSSTWMGYKEHADLEEWERLCRRSNNREVIPNWEEFIKRWDTNVGDLFLIPPGTAHGHGGNQMILEMDTGPSVAGTEYSFFTYDFARNTWDDSTKTMTAPQMKMHLEHSFRNQKWIRETRAKEYHRARPIAIDGNGKFRIDQYTTIPEMPFHIERVFLEEEAHNDTEGKFMQIVTLTEGEKVTIQSVDNPEYSNTIERLQACIIPAGLGKHRYINESGRHAMVVIIRLKEG